MTDEKCFNNVLKLKNYQVNHFAENKNGDFVVEFTKFTENNEISSSRKFYGLKKGGEYFFQDGSDHLREITINNVEENENQNFNLDGSKTLFVYIYNTFLFDIKSLYKYIYYIYNYYKIWRIK